MLALEGGITLPPLSGMTKPHNLEKDMNYPSERKDFNFKDFAVFKSFITPAIITVLFWIGAVLSIALGLFGLFSPYGGPFRGNVLLALLTMFVGPILWRLFCEKMLVLFRIHSELKELNKKQ